MLLASDTHSCCTFIRVHLVERIGGLVGQHAHVWTELLYESLNHHLRCGRVGHPDTLGGHFLTIVSQALEVEPHDTFKLQILNVYMWEREEGGGGGEGSVCVPCMYVWVCG